MNGAGGTGLFATWDTAKALADVATITAVVTRYTIPVQRQRQLRLETRDPAAWSQNNFVSRRKSGDYIYVLHGQGGDAHALERLYVIPLLIPLHELARARSCELCWSLLARPVEWLGSGT